MTGRTGLHFGISPAVALSAWIGVSLLSAVQSSLRDALRGWSDLLAGTLLAWLPWLIFSVPIVRLSRLTWSAGRRAALGSVHVLTAGACSALYLAYLASFRALPRSAALGVWREEVRNVTGEHLLGALLVYVAIAGAVRLSMKGRVAVERAVAPFRGIPVRRRGRTRFVAPAEIDWVAAEGSYVRLHLGRRSELLRRPLSRLAEELAPCGFVRVHRSALVNLDRVREVESAGHGDGRVVLADGTRVRLSRTYRGAFEQVMKVR